TGASGRRHRTRRSRRCSSTWGWARSSRWSSGTESRSSAPATPRRGSRTEIGSSSRGRSPVDSRLYLITAARPDLAELVEAAVRGGVDIVQIREQERPDGELLAVLQQMRALTRRLGVPLVVNDRPDLAVLAEADYVHVGQEDLPVEAARRFGLGVGQSTHAPAELDASEADYLAVGRRPRLRRVRGPARPPALVRDRRDRRDERRRGGRGGGAASRGRARDHGGGGSRTRRRRAAGRIALRNSGGGTRTHNLRVNSAPLCRIELPRTVVLRQKEYREAGFRPRPPRGSWRRVTRTSSPPRGAPRGIGSIRGSRTEIA